MLHSKAITAPSKTSDCTQLIADWVRTLGALEPKLTGNWKRQSKQKTSSGIARVFELINQEGIAQITIIETESALIITNLSIHVSRQTSNTPKQKDNSAQSLGTPNVNISRLTKEEFSEKFCKFLKEQEGQEDVTEISTDYFDIYAIQDLPKVSEGLKKLQFDFENVSSEEGAGYNGCTLTGVQTIDNFTFLGITAGGDWESPIFFILYFDKEGNLVSYIPQKGNPYNIETNCAFGNSDSDEQVMAKYFYAKNQLELAFDNAEIIEDIKARFQLT